MFGSPEFRGTLDGMAAELYLEPSLRVEAELRGKK